MSFVTILRKNVTTARWIGVVMMLAGLLSVLAPLAAGLSLSIFIGILLLVSGLSLLWMAFLARQHGRVWGLVILSLLAIGVGLYMIFQPSAALATLTLVLAVYFMLVGVFQIIAAFNVKPESGWGWVLIGGVITLLLGIMIWRQYPLSGAWAIGTLIGIHLLLSGASVYAIAGMVRNALNHNR